MTCFELLNSGVLRSGLCQMWAGAFEYKCKCKRRIKCKCKYKCKASESNANASANAQLLNQMQVQMHLDQMQMHLDQMHMHLDQRQILFYNYVFWRSASDILLTYLYTKNPLINKIIIIMDMIIMTEVSFYSKFRPI